MAVTGLFLVCALCPAFAQEVPIPEPKPEAATVGAPPEDDVDGASKETQGSWDSKGAIDLALISRYKLFISPLIRADEPKY